MCVACKLIGKSESLGEAGGCRWESTPGWRTSSYLLKESKARPFMFGFRGCVVEHRNQSVENLDRILGSGLLWSRGDDAGGKDVCARRLNTRSPLLKLSADTQVLLFASVLDTQQLG